MPSSRRFMTPFAAITILILLSVLTVISLGEGFKKFGTARDGAKIKQRDTITFNMPWNPTLVEPKQEVKAISPAAGSILDAVGKVASALLDDGSDIANLAQTALSSLVSTVLAGVPSQVPSRIQDVNSQVDRATGVVGGIVTAATGIVGSLLAGPAAPSPAPVIGGETNASVGVNATAMMSLTSRLNVSSSIATMAFNITSAPSLSEPPSTSAQPISAPIPTCAACPAPKTETCTVTETWHSTYYESTATLFSFIAAFTYTCTETVSVCPKSSLYPLAPPNAASPSPMPSGLVACPNGGLAKRAEDCPLILDPQNVPRLGSSSTTMKNPDKTASPHPCPNAGYSCSECPGGVFCPPVQTSAQDCACGYGWACGHCSQGWFCVPSPSTEPALGPVSSSIAISGNSTTSRIPSSSVLSTLPSITANIPNLSSLSSALGYPGPGSGVFQSFPTSSGPLKQATNTVGDLAGNIINNVNSALGNIDGLSGVVLSSVMGQLSSVLGANLGSGISNPTSLGAATGPAGNLISAATVGIAVNNSASGLIPAATGLVGSVAGNVLSDVLPFGGNSAPGPVPTVTGLLGGGLGNVLSSIPSAGGIPGVGLIPSVTELVGSVAGNALSNVPSFGGNPGGGLVSTAAAILSGAPGIVTPVGGLIPTASTIIASANSGSIAAGVPLPAPLFQATVSVPVVNNLLPVFGKAKQEASRTVIPQPPQLNGIQTSPTASVSSKHTTSSGEPSVISHITTTIQGASTALPVVVTMLNGKPTVVPLVKVFLDGKEKDLPMVGVDVTSVVGKIEALKMILDGNENVNSEKGR